MTNFLLHKHRKPDEHFHRPEGLNELISDISREVLRAQPECIYTFLADYLEAMLITREQAMIAKRVVTELIDVSLTIADLLHDAGVSRSIARKSAQIIEECIKEMSTDNNADGIPNFEVCRRSNCSHQFSVNDGAVIESEIMERLRNELNYSDEHLCKAQKIIQVCFKDYYFHETNFEAEKREPPKSVWVACVEKTLDIYKKAAPQRWELERAATTIQAAYRSYYTRRKLAEDKAARERHDTLIEEYGPLEFGVWSIEEMAAAAIKIQAAYRGHLVRKELQGPENGQVESIPSVGEDEFEVEEKVTIVIEETDETHLAATKIQAVYRGHRVRKGIPVVIEELKDSDTGAPMDSSAVGVVELADTEEETVTSDAIDDTQAVEVVVEAEGVAEKDIHVEVEVVDDAAESEVVEDATEPDVVEEGEIAAEAETGEAE